MSIEQIDLLLKKLKEEAGHTDWHTLSTLARVIDVTSMRVQEAIKKQDAQELRVQADKLLNSLKQVYKLSGGPPGAHQQAQGGIHVD